MKVVIYRNIKGIFESLDLNRWESFASLFGFMIDKHETINTTTITIDRREDSAFFTIYRSGKEQHLFIDYLRLESKDLLLMKLMDRLIHDIGLSGEKHLIDGSNRKSTYFKEGMVVNTKDGNQPSVFELQLLKESILGRVHLALDELIDAQRSGDTERANKIKGILIHYQKQLSELNEKIHL